MAISWGRVSGLMTSTVGEWPWSQQHCVREEVGYRVHSQWKRHGGLLVKSLEKMSNQNFLEVFSRHFLCSFTESKISRVSFGCVFIIHHCALLAWRNTDGLCCSE